MILIKNKSARFQFSMDEIAPVRKFHSGDNEIMINEGGNDGKGGVRSQKIWDSRLTAANVSRARTRLKK
jgi:hypothetical protein